MLQEETLAKKFVKKGFWLYIFSFIIAPLGYVTKMTLSRDLGVEEVGMIYGVISFVTLLGVYNDLGFTESLNYFLPRYIVSKEFGKAKYLLGMTITLQTISSSIIVLALFLGAPWLAEHYFHTERITYILQVSGLYFIGINSIHLATTLFSVAQDVKLQKLSELARIGTTTIGVLLLFFSDFGTLHFYMWAWVSGIFVSMIFSLVFAYHRYYRLYFSGVTRECDPKERQQFLRYAGATLLTSNIGGVLSQIDLQLIIYILGATATGYYSNYLSLMNIPFIFISPIISFLFPVISELSGRKEFKKMRIIHERFTLYLSIIGIWTGFFLFQFGHDLSVVFFGQSFALSGYIIMFSAPFLIFNLLTQINFQILSGTGKIGIRAKILAITIPINLVLNLIFIHFFEISGAALAVGLSWIPLWYMSHRSTKEYHGVVHFGTILRNIVFAGGSYVLLAFIMLQLHTTSSLLILLIAVFVNLVIFTTGNLSILREAWITIKNNRH